MGGGVEGVPLEPAVHVGRHLEGLRHCHLPVRLKGVVPCARHDAGIIGDVHPHGIPVPPPDVGEGGQPAPGQGELAALHPQALENTGEAKQGHDGAAAAPGGEDQGVQAAAGAQLHIFIGDGVDLVGLFPLLIQVGQHAHHPPAVSLLGDVEAEARGHEGIVLRRDQIRPVGPDDPQPPVQVHRRHPQGEGDHGVILKGDGHTAVAACEAPLSILHRLGKALLITVDSDGNGPRCQPGQHQAQSQGQRRQPLFPLHFPSPLLPRYWNRSHFNIPL